MTEVLRANNLDKIISQEAGGGLDVEAIPGHGARFICKRKDGKPFFTWELNNQQLRALGEGCLRIANGNAPGLIIPGKDIR